MQGKTGQSDFAENPKSIYKTQAPFKKKPQWEGGLATIKKAASHVNAMVID